MPSRSFGKPSLPAAAPPAGGELLHKASLVHQAVEAIQRKIAAKEWTDVLPGEEAMRQYLGISRVTLRKALNLVAAQGWIAAGGRGCHHAISAGAGESRPLPAERNGQAFVRCLSPVPKLDLVWSTRVIFDEIRQIPATPPLHLVWEHHPALWRCPPAKHLERLTEDHATAGWLLYRANPVIQAWFQSHRVPCVVVGPCHAGVVLPSVYVDNTALGRHASQQAMRLGHRHLAWIAYDLSSASSVQTVAGLEHRAPAHTGGLRVSSIADDLTINGLRLEVRRRLAMKDPPTVFMAMGAAQALPLLGIIHELGLKIPRDVSVMVRDHDPILDRLLPALSRYTFDWVRFGRLTAKLVKAMTGRMAGRSTQKVLMPKFLPGDTLARRLAV